MHGEIILCGQIESEIENEEIRKPVCINDIENSELKNQKVQRVFSEFYGRTIFYLTEKGMYVKNIIGW